MPVSKKEVCSLTHPPLQAKALAVALRLVAGVEGGGMGFPRGELASPQASLSAPHPPSLLVLLALFVSPSLVGVFSFVPSSIRCVEFLRFIIIRLP